MSIDIFDDVAVFDFDEIANHLVEQGLEASPSQIHGCLTGLLAAGAPVQAEYGLDSLSQALDLALHGELASQALQLYSVTADSLVDDEFSFNLVLPDDETDIRERTEAMGFWCKGFLAGFALVSAAPGRQALALSEDSSEILRDIAAIAEASVDDEDSEEDSEESYMELVEFLRFAVLNVHHDSIAMAEAEQEADPQSPLH